MSETMAGGRDLQVLVVDDDPDQRMLVRTLFNMAGFEQVREASDGDAALAEAAADPPGLIVLDLAMPGRSGIDVLPELKLCVPEAEIVVLSNFPRWRLADLTRRKGAVGYVEKRVRPDRLVEAILVAAALAQRATERVSGALDATLTAPRAARELVRDALAPEDEDLVSTIELLVSEMVTNAVVHASSAPTIDIHISPDVVRVEVYDDDTEMPRPRTPDAAAPGGRGLRLLDSMTTQWGADPHEGGKVVWFEVARTG